MGLADLSERLSVLYGLLTQQALSVGDWRALCMLWWLLQLTM